MRCVSHGSLPQVRGLQHAHARVSVIKRKRSVYGRRGMGKAFAFRPLGRLVTCRNRLAQQWAMGPREVNAVRRNVQGQKLATAWQLAIQ